MKCPFCGSEKTKVIDKRFAEDDFANRRRRECLDCGRRFTTYERLEAEKGVKIPFVKKRDGKLVPFKKEKIVDAIFKAAQSVGGKDRELASRLAEKVIENLNQRFDEANIPSVEDVSDAIERVLIKEGHAKTAKAFILYRETRARQREAKLAMLDVSDAITAYIHQRDWRVKENSNEEFSFSGLVLYVSGKVMATYALNEIYPPQISTAHKLGYIHIHDLGHPIIGYCCGHSLKNLLLMGFGGVRNKTEARPAKHLSTVIRHMVNYIGCLQMEFAGAQAFSGVDTLLAPFVKVDSLSYKEVKQCIQELVYGLNIPSRWGAQYPFSNLTFDLVVPDFMQDEKAIVGGKRMPFTYAECQDEMDLLNKAFLEVLSEGDAHGKIFTFPIPTYNLTKDFDWNSEISDMLFEVTAKYGSPYFQNYIGSGLSPRSIYAMCLHPDEEVIIRVDNNIRRVTIKELCNYPSQPIDFFWSAPRNKIEILSLNPESLKVEWVRITKFLRKKGRELAKITTSDGKTIKVSSDHLIPVLTEKGIKLKFAHEIRKGDFLFVLRNARKVLNNSYQYIEEWKLDEKLAFLLGLFTADGNYLYCDKTKIKAKGMQFTFNKEEKELIQLIKRIVKEVLNKDVIIKQDSRYNSVYVYLYHTKFSNACIKAGFNKYGRLPDAIFNSPTKVIRAFLNGFFTGDGYKKGNELHIKDELLARDLTMLYSLTGTPTTIRSKEKSQVIRLQHSHGRGSENKVHRDILYDRIPNFCINYSTVSGERRYLFKHTHKTIGFNMLKRFGGFTETALKILNGDAATVQVENIEIEFLEEPITFYDIELEKNHFFVHSLGTITHNCCRLNMDLTQLMNRPGGMWNLGDSTGSIGVVTINMNRIGYEAKSESEFFEKLEQYMILAKDSLEIKRKIIEQNLQRGLMPYTKVYLGTFRNHFSTIGLVGMNEACLNFRGEDISTQGSKRFTIEVLKFMREKILEFQQETGNLYNLEATPAESAAFRLAMLDKKMYKDIIVSGDKTPFLTNSTQLPVDKTKDLLFALEHQNDIQPLYTGGTIFHTFLGERVESGESCKRLVKKIAYNTKLPYFSITPTFSICKVHGYLRGEHWKCPRCGKPTEVYSRIVGYFRPVQNWNAGKQEEFKFRKTFDYKPLLKEGFPSKIEKAIAKTTA